jgi:hypothetical protein
MSDRPRSQKGAPNPGTLEQSGAPWAVKSAPVPMSLGDSASNATDSRAKDTASGWMNRIKAKCQRLTITALQSKLPLNFMFRYRQLPRTNKNSLVDMAYLNEKTAAPKRGG